MTSIQLEDGKYTVEHNHGAGLCARRYGQLWRDLTGDGLVLAMAQEIEQLREQLADYRVVIEMLDEAKVPLHDDDGATYSLWGRVRRYATTQPKE